MPPGYVLIVDGIHSSIMVCKVAYFSFVLEKTCMLSWLRPLPNPLTKIKKSHSIVFLWYMGVGERRGGEYTLSVPQSATGRNE